MTFVLAANNFGDNLPPGQAGPMGLLIIILLGIACWFLYRSMSKHIRRVPTHFDPPADPHGHDKHVRRGRGRQPTP